MTEQLAVSPPDRESAGGAVAFFDDFSGGTLDRTRWQVATTGPVVNDEQQAYVDEPGTVAVTADGHLALRAQWRPGFTTPEGRRFDFVSGRIHTRDRFHFRYGHAAARIKLPYGTGVWPAFWALGVGEWPSAGELDILEYVGEPDWVSSAIHGPGYSGDAGLVNRRYFAPGTDAGDWHEYSVTWGPELIEFAVDGHVNLRLTRPIVDYHGGWVFDNEMFLVLNVALGGAYPFKVNGITEPYYGLGDDAVERVRAGDVRMLVDWVRVTELTGMPATATTDVPATD